MKRAVYLILLVVLVSCEKMVNDAEILGENADIIGTWIEDGYEDDVTVMERVERFDNNKYGFTLNEDGSFIERKNAGWCGTPPIYYDNFEGEWKAISDSLLEITVGYWGGTMSYQLRIISLDSEQLKIKYLYAENRADS